MSNTQSTQIKVTLPQELYKLVKINADRLGLSMATYIRHLTIQNSWEDSLPTYPMSPKLEARGLRAERDFKAGKAIRIDDIDKFFQNL